jgi:hypothetical protein
MSPDAHLTSTDGSRKSSAASRRHSGQELARRKHLEKGSVSYRLGTVLLPDHD